MKRILKFAGIAIIVILIGMQFIPLSHTNPPVTREIKWNAPETKALAERACYACHSNETVWPAYSYVAPISFVVVNHTNEGREGLNFSQWDQPNVDFDEVRENIERGEMPLKDFLLLHPEARLTAAERQQLIAGLEATFQQDPPIERPER
jgi:hypothetical protein